MKKRIFTFAAGMLTMALIGSLGAGALAAYQRQALLDYSDIKITLDGKTVNPVDANGNSVEPFTIDGTTYLPIRAIANSLGLYVNWDQNSKTVVLSTKELQKEPENTDKLSASSTWQEVQAYLRNAYTCCDTSIGRIPINVTLNENESVDYPYDIRIQLQISKESFDAFNSIKFTDEEKAAAKQELRNYTQGIASDLLTAMPQKKFYCSFTYSYYDYPVSRVGYHFFSMASWINFSLDENGNFPRNYSDAVATEFTWYEKNDLTSWATT